jgi:tRNA dimethylallyltransferase
LSATSSIEETSTAAKPRVVVVAGPTATGKSALALAIAEEFDGVVINADSQQRYADLSILTARPTPHDVARAPHLLFGDLAADESGSAAEWALKAAAEIQNATAARTLPILVGGTGLYFRALMEGLSDIPAVPPEVRTAAQALLDEIGHAAFHTRLAARDPATAARLKTGDTQRLLRAWEVVEATGTPLTAWHAAPLKPPLAAAYFSIRVLPPRAEVYAACDDRFIAMIESGALAEVRALDERGVPADAPVRKALGVPELTAHIAGDKDLASALNAAQTATRQYAKRQTTWFSNQFNADLTINKKLSESLLPEIFSNIRHFLLT